MGMRLGSVMFLEIGNWPGTWPDRPVGAAAFGVALAGAAVGCVAAVGWEAVVAALAAVGLGAAVGGGGAAVGATVGAGAADGPQASSRAMPPRASPPAARRKMPRRLWSDAGSIVRKW